MNCLIWNIRGLRASESQQRLHAFVKEKQIKVLAVLEPLIDLDPRYMTPRLGFSGVISNLSGHIWRREIWASLLLVKPVLCPWLVGGDFNVVRSASECLGSRGGRFLPMEEFNTFILDCGQIDACFEGSSFTWTNKTIWKRLDRVLVSVDWGDHFSSIRVEHLARIVSDHCPLLVTAPVFARGPSSFRFQRMWVRHHGFLQTVRLNWNLPSSMSGMPRLLAKMKRLKHYLRWWNRDVFDNIFDRLTEAERAVHSAEDVCEADPSDANWTLLSDRNEDLARITAWRRIFGNRKRLAIGLRMSGALFFKDLLTGELSALDCPDFSSFPSVISAVENDGITAIPSLEEVRAIVFSIHPDSVAGPDGFSSTFFQHCWEIVHQDVFGSVLDCFQGSPMPQGFTAATITLIPKLEERVVALVSACISHCHFSVNINGSLSGFFGSTRGLRKGDPLSPLLFILGAEYLSRGLDRLYLQHPAIRYQSDCDILISHLAYADDVIIFASGGSRACECCQELFDFASEVLWVPPLPAFAHHRVRRGSSAPQVPRSSPLIGVIAHAPFLSPSYSLWFNHLLLSWRSMSGPSMPSSGVETLGKEVALGPGSSLWARFLFRKYCRLDAPACVPARASISPIWRRLLRIRLRAEPGIRWRVGLGDVSFWDDTWFGDVPLSSRCVVRGGRDVRVSHFLSEGSWDFDRLCAVVAPSVAKEIVLIPVLSGDPDLARWIHSSDGAFSVRSAWELIRQRAPSSDIFRPCWGSWLRPTMSFFLWKFWHQWLPVDEVLQRWGFALASRCQCCDMAETFTHIFIRSPVAQSVRHFFGVVFRCVEERFGMVPGGHVLEFLPCIVLSFLWTARNDAKHRHLPVSEETVKYQILYYLRLAHSAHTVKPRHWLGVFHVATMLGISVALHRFHRMAIVRWLRPPSGCFKLNVDGRSRGISRDSSAGGVVRDDSWRVVFSFSEFIGAGSSLRTELWAVWRGLLLCSDHSFFPLWIELDSLTSIQLIFSRRCCWGLDHIVSRILVLLFRGFLFSPVLPVWCDGPQTLAHYMFGLLGIEWALVLSLLVLFFGPLIFPGGRFCQDFICISPYTSFALLLSDMVDLDDISQCFSWPELHSRRVLQDLYFCGRGLPNPPASGSVFRKKKTLNPKPVFRVLRLFSDLSLHWMGFNTRFFSDACVAHLLLQLDGEMDQFVCSVRMGSDTCPFHGLFLWSGRAPAPSPLVLFTRPLMLSGGRFLQASPCSLAFFFYDLLMSVMAALDYLSQWFLWPRATFIL
ncbi:uncharacterized protein [Primulina eburnea]|uniref:uncharacterized protein n=1 Tax=Primulina eburnea TaxID=1245227 RepID=UPI003C6C0B4D